MESKERSQAIKYAREHIMYRSLASALVCSLSIVEYARHVAAVLEDAHSIELDPNTTRIRLFALMPDQNGVEDIGGTLSLGSYPCVLDKDIQSL